MWRYQSILNSLFTLFNGTIQEDSAVCCSGQCEVVFKDH